MIFHNRADAGEVLQRIAEAHGVIAAPGPRWRF